MATKTEKRTCTWTPGLPELNCDGSIEAAIKDGAVKFHMDVAPAVWEGVSGVRRLAVIDPEAWRAEVEVENVERVDEDTVRLTLTPANFPCDRCGGSGQVAVQPGADSTCDLCDEGTIPAHAIKGEWYVPELGEDHVVDGPGVHMIMPSGPLAHKAYPREVDARWRPCEN